MIVPQTEKLCVVDSWAVRCISWLLGPSVGTGMQRTGLLFGLKRGPEASLQPEACSAKKKTPKPHLLGALAKTVLNPS